MRFLLLLRGVEKRVWRSGEGFWPGGRGQLFFGRLGGGSKEGLFNLSRSRDYWAAIFNDESWVLGLGLGLGLRGAKL